MGSVGVSLGVGGPFRVRLGVVWGSILGFIEGPFEEENSILMHCIFCIDLQNLLKLEAERSDLKVLFYFNKSPFLGPLGDFKN